MVEDGNKPQAVWNHTTTKLMLRGRRKSERQYSTATNLGLRVACLILD